MEDLREMINAAKEVEKNLKWNKHKLENFIGVLYRWAQMNGKSMPMFDFEATGNVHLPQFKCSIKIDVHDQPFESVQFGNKKDAKAYPAMLAVTWLRENSLKIGSAVLGRVPRLPTLLDELRDLSMELDLHVPEFTFYTEYGESCCIGSFDFHDRHKNSAIDEDYISTVPHDGKGSATKAQDDCFRKMLNVLKDIKSKRMPKPPRKLPSDKLIDLDEDEG